MLNFKPSTFEIEARGERLVAAGSAATAEANNKIDVTFILKNQA